MRLSLVFILFGWPIRFCLYTSLVSTNTKWNLTPKHCTVTDKTRPPPGQPQQIWQNESGEPVTVKRKDTTHIAFQWAQEADGCMYTRVPLLIQSLGSSAATSVPHQSPFWCISARGIHYDSFKQCRDELHNAMNIDLSICLPIISWFWDNCIAVRSGVWQRVQDSGVIVCCTVLLIQQRNANTSHCVSELDFNFVAFKWR